MPSKPLNLNLNVRSSFKNTHNAGVKLFDLTKSSSQINLLPKGLTISSNQSSATNLHSKIQTISKHSIIKKPK